jgi:hypothetical protein
MPLELEYVQPCCLTPMTGSGHSFWLSSDLCDDRKVEANQSKADTDFGLTLQVNPLALYPDCFLVKNFAFTE